MVSQSAISKVYTLVKEIPNGKVTTYKEIAEKTGIHPRTVGFILSKNKSSEIPCHRVIKSNQELGGYNRGIEEKKRILREEGIVINEGKVGKDHVVDLK